MVRHCVNDVLISKEKKELKNSWKWDRKRWRKRTLVWSRGGMLKRNKYRSRNKERKEENVTRK